jgi:hypothetical protein
MFLFPEDAISALIASYAWRASCASSASSLLNEKTKYFQYNAQKEYSNKK